MLHRREQLQHVRAVLIDPEMLCAVILAARSYCELSHTGEKHRMSGQGPSFFRSHWARLPQWFRLWLQISAAITVAFYLLAQSVLGQIRLGLPETLGLWLFLLILTALLLRQQLRRSWREQGARLDGAPDDGQSARAVDARGERLGDLSAQVDALKSKLELRESELQAVRHFARVGFWSCDLGSGQVQWSPEVESLIGWRAEMRESPLTRLFEQVVDAADFPSLNESLENALTSGQAFSCEFRAHVSQDRTTWLNTAAEVVTDDLGKPRYLRGILQYIGERKEAESGREEYANLFERLFESTGTLMSLSDPSSGRLVDVNPAFERMTGYPRGMAVGRSWPELGIATAEQREATLARLRRDQSVRNQRVSGRNRAGEQLELQYSGTLIEIGGQTRVLSMAQDITELVRSEDALRHSQQRLELAMRATNDGLWDINLRTQEVYYSPRWKEMLGYREDELPNDIATWKRVADPDSDKRAWELLNQVAAGKTSGFTIEIKLKHKSGHWIDVLARAYLVRDDDGEPLRLVGTHTDVTLLKQALSDAERERQRAADYLKIAGVIIVALDLDGRVTLINDKGCALLGREEADIIGMDWVEHFLPQRVRAEAGHFFPQMRDGELDGVAPLDEPILSADGREHIISWHNGALRDADGQIIGTLSSGLDVTERRQAEADLARERSFLQHVIDGIDDPLMVICEDYQVIRINSAAARLAESRGLTGQDLTCHQLLYSSDIPCAERGRECPLSAVLQLGKPSKVVHLEQGSEGSIAEAGEDDPAERSYEISASPLYDDQGEIVGIIEVARDISEQLAIAAELKRSEHSVMRLSQYDLLTSLPNRLLFADRLSAGIAEARAHGACLAVMIVDLDRFKHINDSFDHHDGDEVLKGVAARLQHLVGEQETLARLGGDEFGIIPRPFQQQRVAAGLAERIHEVLLEPFALQGQRVLVGASIGIALYPKQGETADDLLRKADAALYSAKADGGKTTRFFTEELTADARDRLELEVNLQEALERDEFELYYQPQVDLNTGALSGVEALVRWRHPERGMISPGHFIPLAEESGLINPLGDWVLRTACEQMRVWREAGVLSPRASMSVNLSARQFEQAELAQKVLGIVQGSGLAASALEIEITESTVMQSPQRSIDCLHRLRQAGIKVAVDDFGTGYSSMSYLKRLPLTKLKIDRSFVSDIPEDTNDVAIVRAIIALGTSLSLELLAEGIETEQQRDFLLEEGCWLGQGYLFAKPLSDADFVRFARDFAATEGG
ncbi:hypothetical protein CCR91_17635 [Thiorhodovibrio winogradskyi]|nr:hypothetical protein [Thiorhodovibrio winogradskyi]